MVKIVNFFIGKVLLCFDGVGCYYSNNLIVVLNEVYVYIGIRVLRYE